MKAEVDVSENREERKRKEGMQIQMLKNRKRNKEDGRGM